MKNSDIAWAAGLFEGEGCVRPKRISKTKKCYAHASVSNTDLDVLEEFYRIIGFGKIYGPYTKGRKKPLYQWVTNSWPEVNKLYKLFKPWLKSRRIKQFEEIFEKIPKHIKRGETVKNKTHCKRGHKFSKENTCISSTTGVRRCRKCRNDNLKIYRKKNGR